MVANTLRPAIKRVENLMRGARPLIELILVVLFFRLAPCHLRLPTAIDPSFVVSIRTQTRDVDLRREMFAGWQLRAHFSVGLFDGIWVLSLTTGRPFTHPGVTPLPPATIVRAKSRPPAWP